MSATLEHDLRASASPGGAGGAPEPRAGLVSLVAIIVCVVSFGKYDLVPLLPYALFPALLLARRPGQAWRVAKRTLVLLPFAILVGAFNPWLDRAPRALGLGIVVAGGWISFAGIVVRFLICVASALALTAVLPFADLCRAARRLGLPAALTAVLLFLWRYLSLLLGEGRRLRQAREARAGGHLGWRSAAGVIGNLFLRTVDRADRIHAAMLARGFRGELPGLHRSRLAPDDWAFLALVVGAAVAWRLLAPTVLATPGAIS